MLDARCLSSVSDFFPPRLLVFKIGIHESVSCRFFLLLWFLRHICQHEKMLTPLPAGLADCCCCCGWCWRCWCRRRQFHTKNSTRIYVSLHQWNPFPEFPFHYIVFKFYFHSILVLRVRAALGILIAAAAAAAAHQQHQNKQCHRSMHNARATNTHTVCVCRRKRQIERNALFEARQMRREWLVHEQNAISSRLRCSVFAMLLPFFLGVVFFSFNFILL